MVSVSARTLYSVTVNNDNHTLTLVEPSSQHLIDWHAKL